MKRCGKMTEDKRFIEEIFPVKEVSDNSADEKRSHQGGNISTLHIWWARRPLASSRATSYAALIPYSSLEKDEKLQFIKMISESKNSLNKDLIEIAREEILKCNGRSPPKILDPFAGGGSIPLEAYRLGCETHALEYNPVAVTVLKCTLEYPQKYKNQKDEKGDFEPIKSQVSNELIKDLKEWGNWVLTETEKEIGKFYLPDDDGSIPVGYIWARTVKCQNLTCNAEIPLMRQFWLTNKNNKKISLFPYVEDKNVKFKIVGEGYEKWPLNFDPEKGTVHKAIARCPVCGSTIDDDTIRKLFQEGLSDQRLVAVVVYKKGKVKKSYRLATPRDGELFRAAERYLNEKRKKLMEEWEIDPVPDEPVPPKATLGSRVQRYGILKWGDLFNSRQKLALITFTEKVRLAYEKMIREGYDKEYAKVLTTYLALIVDRVADYENNLCRWNFPWDYVVNLFSRQVIPMVWNYAELNPLSPILTGTWKSMQDQVLDTVSKLVQIPTVKYCNKTLIPEVLQGSATQLPYSDNYFDAVFTDPPYYDNVPYSYLSDFFYVWLKRSIGELYPDLFVTPLTPKAKEIVAYSNLEGGYKAGKQYFEDMLKKAFSEISRVLKPNGIAIIVYAHKSTFGWETLINSLIDSGLVPTASWPINTELKVRINAQESAALASSIYFVCRKMKKEEIGWLNKVKDEINSHISEKLEKLWNEGVSGADFFIAGIGLSIEIFGKYKKVMDLEGREISASDLLDYVREVVTDYAVKQILHNGVAGELSSLTRFYILWRWTYGESSVPFDDARKIAQSTGINLEKEWNRGFIVKEKELIKVVGPQERNLEELEHEKDMIDVLHKVLLLWKNGKKEEIINVLKETGYGTTDAFYRVAQAISETLSNESKEKKLIEEFLSDKERLKYEIKNMNTQKRMDEYSDKGV